jgi:hypothetical protein
MRYRKPIDVALEAYAEAVAKRAVARSRHSASPTTLRLHTKAVAETEGVLRAVIQNGKLPNRRPSGRSEGRGRPGRS